jgi:hypothetical protein
MVIGNKRGWIRIMEAIIAIFLVFGVLLVMYSKQTNDQDIVDYMYNLQQEVLSEVSLRNDLRAMALYGNESALNESVGSKIPSAFGYYLKICDFGDVEGNLVPCNLPEDLAISLFRESKDVYVDEVIISADFEIYNPKRVKLFIWESAGVDFEVELGQGSEPPTEFVMPTGLVSWWKLENDFTDFEGSNPGVNSGSTFVQGKVGNASKFDGVGDHVEISSPDSSTNINIGTISVWINTSNAGIGYRGVVVKGDAYGIFLNENEVGIYDWGGGGWQGIGTYLNDSVWHHVVVSFESGVANGVKIYLDGSDVWTTDMNVINQSFDLSIGYGGSKANSQFFNGTIDEVMLFNRALNISEVQAIRNEQIS